MWFDGALKCICTKTGVCIVKRDVVRKGLVRRKASVGQVGLCFRTSKRGGFRGILDTVSGYSVLLPLRLVPKRDRRL